MFITKETLYEVKETKENINLKKAIDEENEKIYKNITKNLDKSVKIVDKITEYSPEGESCKIRNANYSRRRYSCSTKDRNYG